MRDLVFKNITSSDRKKKIIASSEFSEEQGVSTSVCRHFLCRVVDVLNTKNEMTPLPKPSLYVVKKTNTKLQAEVFYCRIKGSMYIVNKEALYLIDFIHSLRINLKHSVRSA